MAELRGVNLLQNELERAKESLKDVDENIKKLTGRDPTIQRPQRRVSLGSSEPRGGKSVGAERIFNLARRGIQITPDDEGPRRRAGGAFSRLGPRPGGRDRGGRGRDSGDEEDSRNRPAVQSSVIATPKEDRSRQNSIEEQARDRKGQARNRRMFGLLLGTLQKFKDESKESKEKEEQRVKIEKKLEEKFKQEKEEIIKERRQLFLERRKKQFRIRLIEQKMEMAQNHENWAAETRKLENFIRTKAKPHLFYMPRILTPDSESKLRDSKAAVDAMIEERRKKLEHEIEEMMSQVHDYREDEDEDDGDASMGEEDKGSDEEGESEGEGEHRDNKENRDRHKSEIVEEFLTERELRDREREQRDRDRRLKDMRKEERGRRREDRGERKREGSRDRSKDGKDKSKEREKDRNHTKHRDRSRSQSREHSRERHRSGKNRSEKRSRHHSEGERQHGHASKPKRRSKGEGKTEKREKVWEPMEDEEEEEFVGTKDSEKDGNIQSKMLLMAGMTDVVKEKKTESEIGEIEFDKTKFLESRGIEVSNVDKPRGVYPEMGNTDNDNLQEKSNNVDQDKSDDANTT
ncbi:pinin-like [Mercenaria mercenaria]|uniref:pinin-like n=1 Tax=Mercenaria mercenaria TaxID=6596 RepID=UPI00234EF982|nr:pinin-like [Mercenaria mercenaria]